MYDDKYQVRSASVIKGRASQNRRVPTKMENMRHGSQATLPEIGREIVLSSKKDLSHRYGSIAVENAQYLSSPKLDQYGQMMMQKGSDTISV